MKEEIIERKRTNEKETIERTLNEQINNQNSVEKNVVSFILVIHLILYITYIYSKHLLYKFRSYAKNKRK